MWVTPDMTLTALTTQPSEDSECEYETWRIPQHSDTRNDAGGGGIQGVVSGYVTAVVQGAAAAAAVGAVHALT